MRSLPLLLLALFILGSQLPAEAEDAANNAPWKPWQLAGIRTGFGDSRVPYVESAAAVQREALKICAQRGWGAALDPHEAAAYLASPDPAAKKAAIVVLGQIGKEASFSVKDLVNLLAASKPDQADLSELAAETLGRLAAAGAPAADMLAVLLESPDDATRFNGVVAFVVMGQYGAAHAKEVARLLTDKNPQVRITAARALGNMGEGAWPYATNIACLLRDPESPARSSAVVALSHSQDGGSEFVSQMEPLLEDQTAFVRSVTVTALGKTKNGREALAAKADHLMRDPNFGIRTQVCKAIAKIGSAGEQIVAKLMSDLDPETRQRALEDFGRLKGDAKVFLPQITQALSDPVQKVREAAVTAMIGTGRDGAGFAARLLDDSKPEVRSNGLQILRRFKSEAKAQLPAIVHALEDSDANVRRDAASALYGLGEDTADFAPNIEARLKDADPDVRRLLAATLGSLGKKGASRAAAVAGLLDDSDPAIRRASVTALSRMGAAGAGYAKRIIPFLEQDDQRARLEATLALRRMGRDAAQVAPEVAALLGSQNSLTRVAALSVLEAMGDEGAGFAREIDALRKDPDAKVRCAVAYVLGGMASGAHASAVAEMLSDRDADVRSTAAYNLGQMGNAAAAFSSQISALLADKEEHVRAVAEEAIANLRFQGLPTPNDTSGQPEPDSSNAVPTAKDVELALDNANSDLQDDAYKYFDTHGNFAGDLDLQAAFLEGIHKLPANKAAARRAHLRLWAGDNEEMQRSVTWLGKPDAPPLPKEGLSPDETRKTLAMFSDLWRFTTSRPELRDELVKRISEVAKTSLQSADTEIANLSRELAEKVNAPAEAPVSVAPHAAAENGPANPIDQTAPQKRQIATKVLEETRILDAATDQFAIENGVAGGVIVIPSELQNYVKIYSRVWLELSRPGGPKDLLGHSYGVFEVDLPPAIPTATFEALKDVADKTFWGAYAPGSEGN